MASALISPPAAHGDGDSLFAVSGEQMGTQDGELPAAHADLHVGHLPLPNSRRSQWSISVRWVLKSSSPIRQGFAEV